jgi:NAD(P)H-hydrate epimerase
MNYRQSSSNEAASGRYDYVFLCYSGETIRKLDQLMVERGHVDNSYQLMNRAAKALLDFINRKYSDASRLTIVCGAGNNAGDGYVLARIALEQEREPRLKPHVVSVIDPNTLSGDAAQAYKDWLECGGSVERLQAANFAAADLIVDALIGTGLDRSLEGDWYQAVEAINQTNVPVLSVDIPSGLDANTGATLNIAVHADDTITFIGHKMGMYTAQARYYCGNIHLASLGVPQDLYYEFEPGATLLEWNHISKKLPARSPVSHKGDHGHLLIVGGDYGMAGAARIAGEAALRSGVGLVSIATRKENVNAITSSRPELMVHGMEQAEDLDPLLEKATAVAVGPGLGTSHWGRMLMDHVIKFLKLQPDSDGEHAKKKVNCVMDADALNLMAKHNIIIQNRDIIYTPHFGEACRLLKYIVDCPSEQTDRFDMVKKLREKYYGVFVLKGPGTLINYEDNIFICPYGNAGMASAGMGDCLTGIIGAILAQKVPVKDAVRIGVTLHAKAGDVVATDGKIGMIVSDMFPKIRELVNH